MPPVWLQWLAGQTVQKTLTREVIEQGLDELCSAPPPTRDGAQPRIADNSFARISNLLKSAKGVVDYPAGSADRPRIFAVLWAIRRLDVMPVFVSERIFDFSIPFDINQLPTQLGKSKEAFIAQQKVVCTDTKAIELGTNGHHISLATSGNDLFIWQRYLGRGGQGSVDQVLSRLTYETYAKKVFPRRGGRSQIQARYQAYVREVNALKRLRHEHVVKVIGSYSDPECFAILMQPVAQCNLEHFLELCPEYYFSTLRSMFGCLASTLVYLHDHEKIHHMDLKLSNILYNQGRIYVTDFGSNHDFSGTDRSTTQTFLPYTPRYAPPELFNRPFAPRNWATDMWSLGVVFLEMVTVLRGKRVNDFRAYLQTKGSKRPYVSGNQKATTAWFSILQASPTGVQFDNEPLIWIKDLTCDIAGRRPRAHQLLRQISQSPSTEQWIGPCCADSSYSKPKSKPEAESNPVEGPDDGVYADALMSSKPIDSGNQVRSSTKNQSILDWRTDVNIGFFSPPGSFPDDFLNETNHEDDNDATDSYDKFTRTDDRISLPYEISEDDTMLLFPFKKAASFADQDVVGFGFLDQVPPDIRSETGELGDYEDSNHGSYFEVEDDSSSSDDSEKTITLLSNMKQPGDVSVSEFLLEAALEEEVIDVPDDCRTTSLNGPEMANGLIGRANKGSKADIDNSGVHNDQRIQNGSDCGFSSSQYALVPGRENQDSFLRRESRPTTQPVDRYFRYIQEDGETSWQPVSYSQSPLDDQLRQTPGSDESNPTAINDPVQTGKEISPSLSERETRSSSSKDEIPLSSRKEATRERSQTLTIGGLASAKVTTKSKPNHIPTVQKRKTAPKRLKQSPAVSAEQYIAEVYRAETEAATSVASEKTARLYKLGVSITRKMDHDFRYLEWMAREGNARAVQILLEKGCNPGTILEPRPRPLLNAVSGATPRHTKCVRALLNYGSDITVTRKGKPTLHIAIEHEYFKGYGNLVCELLLHGADPNARDSLQDTALHKILLGGFEPLSKHRRDALALLLYFGADVDAVPPGTLQKPIHLAVRRDDPWAVCMLLHKGANVNTDNGAGMSPLALAISNWKGHSATDTITKNQHEVLRHLLEAGADVDEPIGAARARPLHQAVQCYNRDVVTILVFEYGADVSLVDGAGRTPLALLQELNERSPIKKTVLEALKQLLSLPEEGADDEAKGFSE